MICQRYENATIFLVDSFFHCMLMPDDGSCFPLFNEVQEVGKTSTNGIVATKDIDVIFVGILHNIWGHCLTDSLKKLWFLRTNECQQLIKKGSKIVYIQPKGEPLKPYSLQLLEMAGLDVSALEPIQEDTRYKTIFVPDNSLVCYKKTNSRDWHFSYTKEFEETINLIKSKIPADDSQESLKLYFSRTRVAKSSREMGEESLERVFRKEGYQIVYPETLGLEEQFNLLAHCKEFVSTEGSISHSAIFCRPGTKVTILKKADYENGYQTVLNQIGHLDVTYVKAHRTHNDSQWGNPMYGPFYMCITPELEHFVGHRIFHLPLWIRPSWWWYCNRNRKIVHMLYRLIGKE